MNLKRLWEFIQTAVRWMKIAARWLHRHVYKPSITFLAVVLCKMAQLELAGETPAQTPPPVEVPPIEEKPAATPVEPQIRPPEGGWKQKAFYDFSQWLETLPEMMPEADEPDAEGCDLYTLLTEFVALRQEIKLQNREQHSAIRTQQGLIDSHKEIMGLFEDKTRQLDRLEENIRKVSERKTITPFLDIRDALNRGLDAARSLAAKRGIFGSASKSAVPSVVEGYEMALRRYDRALSHTGIAPVDALGKPFDPVTMQAVAQRVEKGVPAGQVLEMVLCGFVCDNEVIRAAQVVVSAEKTS